MKKRHLVLVLGVLAAASAIMAPAAVAATEFGDPCLANEATGEEEGGFTLFGISSATDPLPLSAPSAGVITSWKLNLFTPEPPSKPIPAIIPQTLKVLRLNTAAHTAQVVGEASGLVGSGTNTIPARIPVQAGDRLGLFGHGQIAFEGSTGEIGTLYCEEEGGSGNVVGAFAGTAPVGGSSTYEEVSGNLRVSAVAVLEPDADNDGYGDETQDKCPTSAATQAPCPVIALSTRSVVKKGLATVFITASSQASVTVTAATKVGKGKPVDLNGGTQIVVPGTLAKFTLLFPKKLRTALKRLPRKRSLSLNVKVTAPNVVGSPTTKILKLRLKGQAKPKKGPGHKKSKGRA